MSTASRTEVHMKLRRTSALPKAQSKTRCGTRFGTRFGADSATNAGGYSQCTVPACGVSDPGGAAAARLLFRFTLDPCLGSTQVYPVFSVTWPFRSTGVYR